MADSKIPFREFCEVCEKIQQHSKFPDKENLLRNFIKKYNNTNEALLQGNSTAEATFYPALRLLIPEYERDRGPYGLKEHTFARMIVRVLCLQGSDANNLLKYNKVSSGSKSSSDFADVAYWVLRKWCPDTSSLTIADVNGHLNQMVLKHAEHQPREVDKELSKMIKNSTAVEQKWIIRIILKSMRLGLGNDRILQIFHRDAPDLYDVSNSLSKICTVLKDPNTRLHELEIELFTPFRPMLSLQCDAVVLDKIFKEESVYYVENKYDGERFQMHMKDGTFKYFSKNGYDYSSTYGENYDSSGLITPHLKKIFSGIQSVILDGEMMGWNTKKRNFGSKGMSYDVKNLKSDSTHRPCFCVFDILLLNGDILTNKPLTDRLNIMDNVFTPIEGIIICSPRLEVKTKQEMTDELNKSVDREEEGICFKDPNSIYKPNNRKAGWWKMKLEYFEGLMTELDLLIIGGYYGEGRRKGLISSFLLGVAATPNNAWESSAEFHTFAKVANGFKIEELDNLLRKLNPHWESFEKNKNPDGIVWKREKPDCWINPRKSCVLQVKASELARTADFQTGYTLRFPRVQKVRDDKPWYNCLTTDELKELTKSNKAVEKLSGRHLTEGDVDVSPTKRSRKSDQGSLFHLFNVEQKSNLLASKEFCVFTGNKEYTKETVEVKIKECGGRVVQFPGPQTTCTLIGDLTPRAKSLISSSVNDIVRLEWMIKIIEMSSSLLTLTPEDMITTSAKTKMVFSGRYDKYGDSYTQPATKESLKNAFSNIDAESDYVNPTPSEFENLDKKLCFQNPLGIFRPCFVYFDKYKVVNDSTSEKMDYFQQVEWDFIFYGGTNCERIEDYVTHVVIHSSDQSRMNSVKKAVQESGNEDVKVVNERWIQECLNLKKLISENKFEYA